MYNIPQMSPMLWLNLYIYFLLCMLIFITIIYFLMSYIMKEKISPKNLKFNFFYLTW